jgi:spore maturation protein CgeB
MYPGNLKLFHNKFQDLDKLSYREYLDLLMKDTTEFAGSYYRTLRHIGIEADCVIANDNVLLKKRQSESGNITEVRDEFFLNQIQEYNPDVLWIDNLSVTDVTFLRDIRKTVKSVKLIICFHCSPFGPKILERLPYIDFVITCTPGLKVYMESLGHRSYFVYHGFDSSIRNRIGTGIQLASDDIVFSGSLSTGPGFHRERIHLLEDILKADLKVSLYVNTEKQYRIMAKQFLYLINRSLKAIRLEKCIDHFPVLHYGEEKVKNYPDLILKKKLEPVFGMEMYNLFANSKIVLNNHLGATGNYAGNMRLFEATGVGSCLLTDYKINNADLFIPGKEIIVYDSINDCIEKARWLLEHDDERKKIALAGQLRTLSSHTVEMRCREIIEIITNELEKD